MSCGPEIEGSSFLGGLEHPERMMRLTEINKIEKRTFFEFNIPIPPFVRKSLLPSPPAGRLYKREESPL
jgi:hypothetical protein